MVAVDNPVLARRYRGGVLESLHRGAWVVVDTGGAVVAAAGDPDQPIFARSSSKSLQASGVLALGVAESLELEPAHVAVMVSSHNGETEHVVAAREILGRVGLDESALQCGHASPMGRPDLPASRICHNCSGKHSGFLAGAVTLEQDPATYLDPMAPIQQHVRSAVQRIADVADDRLGVAVDGCSAPTFILPLRNLALGIARIANPTSLAETDRASAQSIVSAAEAHPSLVAGRSPARFDTAVLETTKGRLFAKGGADGVQVIGVRDAGIAFAGKADDGNDRGLVPVALQVLAELGHLSDDELHELDPWVTSQIRNADGLIVGTQELEPRPL
ncbi:MAG: asparaginase [Actinomycetota bacterium]